MSVPTIEEGERTSIRGPAMTGSLQRTLVPPGVRQRPVPSVARGRTGIYTTRMTAPEHGKEVADNRPGWLPANSGAASELIAEVDWSDHPLGHTKDWPSALKVLVATTLAAPEAMHLVWGAERTFLFNDAYAPLLRGRARTAMGGRFEEVFPDALQRLREPFQRALSGETVRFVDVAVPDEGGDGSSPRWWSFSYTPARDERGQVQGVLCVTTETTERVRHRGAMSAAESYNRQVLDGATDSAIIATDLDGRIRRWNEGARRLFGWTESEMVGHSCNRIVPEAERHAGLLADERGRALDHGRANGEGWRVRADGSTFWATAEMTPLLDAHGRPSGFVKVLRDRTAEHRALAQLERSEAGLRRAQQAGGIGVFSVDRDNRVHGTEEFCRIFGMRHCDGVPAADV